MWLVAKFDLYCIYFNKAIEVESDEVSVLKRLKRTKKIETDRERIESSKRSSKQYTPPK
jgi:7,8-dihydro-6-hydroxymethylpterin-pyrophosphokinase